jgi:hypothetical protein
LGAGAASAITLGAGWNISAAGGIRSLSLADGAAGTGFHSFIILDTGPSSISAAWIGTLTDKIDTSLNLTLSGAGSPGGVALASASFTQGLTTSIWSVTGSVGKLALHGAAAGFDLSATGPIKNISDIGDLAGNLAAQSFGSISITGDLSGDILAGANFGADGLPGGGDDTFAAGSITSLRIGGNATSTAIVAAGLDPVDDNIVIDPSDTLFTTGFIKSITINGTADPAARFVAATLPAKVRIGKTIVIPSTDPRFQL